MLHLEMLHPVVLLMEISFAGFRKKILNIPAARRLFCAPCIFNQFMTPKWSESELILEIQELIFRIPLFPVLSAGTALHLGCLGGDQDVVGLLLHHKADAMRQDCHGRLPIHYASLCHNINCLELFVARRYYRD